MAGASEHQYLIAGSSTGSAAGIALGCLGVLMLGLQPLLLGALLNEHRLTVSQLTQAATLEQLALGVTAGALGAFANRRNLRLYACIGCGVLLLANLFCTHSSGMTFIWSRGLSGVGGGVLLWIAGAVIAFSHSPARLAALFVGAQSLSQCALATVLPITLMPWMGGDSGFVTMAGLAILSVALVSYLPPHLPAVTGDRLGLGQVGMRACAGLASSLLFMAAIVGFWVFVEPLGAASHVTASVGRFIVAYNLGAQFVGAMMAILLARTLAPLASWVVAACGGALLLALTLVSTGAQHITFVAAIMLHGLAWTVGLSFYVPLLIQLDPTRRGALLLPGAELLGASAGPLVAGLLATETQLTPVLVSTAMFALTSVACIGLASILFRRGAPT